MWVFIIYLLNYTLYGVYNKIKKILTINIQYISMYFLFFLEGGCPLVTTLLYTITT